VNDKFPNAGNEKSTPVMVYTSNSLSRGEVITRQAIRVNTWFRTQAAPEFLCIRKAQVLLQGVAGLQNLAFDEYHIPIGQVLAMHMIPPVTDELDFDQSEPNRKMEPVTVMVSNFRMNACIRMATQSNLGKFLDTARETWLSIYEVEISNSSIPGMGVLHVPAAIIRLSGVTFATRRTDI